MGRVVRVPKIYVFIDSNIYLNFYDFAVEDLKELEKMKTAIGNGTMALFVTQQVVDEVWRNREEADRQDYVATQVGENPEGVPCLR